MTITEAITQLLIQVDAPGARYNNFNLKHVLTKTQGLVAPTDTQLIDIIDQGITEISLLLTTLPPNSMRGLKLAESKNALEQLKLGNVVTLTIMY